MFSKGSQTESGTQEELKKFNFHSCIPSHTETFCKMCSWWKWIIKSGIPQLCWNQIQLWYLPSPVSKEKEKF